jgi:glycosyltransferase involved in cell wall biosynthesis
MELVTLYREAQALLFPSLAEGWGFPLAEALTMGTPVIASDLPVCREVGGTGPVYLAPQSRNAWSEAIVASAAKERERLSGRKAPAWKWTEYFNAIKKVF